MDRIKIGNLITKIRKNKKLTQKKLAQVLNVSDKTISKWERGQGCPDIDSLNNLAEVLDVNISELLSGEVVENENDAGNMKKTKFYVCPVCGNVITSSNDLVLNCCGRKLLKLQANREGDNSHSFIMESVEDDLFVSVKHEMEKKHYISFLAYVTLDKVIIGKLYPEQDAEVRFKRSGHGILYAYCNQHGLWMQRI